MDSAIEKQFHDYLVSLGFPPDAIIYEPAFKPSIDGRRYRPDFAVLDAKTREPLAIIELKETIGRTQLQSALQQVRWYTNQFQNPSIRAYVVTPSGTGGFVFYQDDGMGSAKKVDPSFVEATSLASASTAERKEILAARKKRTIDSFFVVCYVAAGAAFFIALADFLLKLRGVTVLTPERLILLGSAAGLLIVPFLQKFKALGIEIERQGGKTDG